ncbi:MAG: glycerate kinase, partial [Demequinaceae bacterium]|nr:glycerate kinase [Demequinaceae bacterium]
MPRPALPHGRGGAARIVIAMDSFKGSVTSAQACEAAREGALRAAPDAIVTVIPVADGGEGTLDALAPFGRPGEVQTFDLLGRPLRAAHLMLGDAAVIESATTVGLGLLGKAAPPLARRAHSYGLGLQIERVAALERPARILVGLGGTGCTDGGTGALLAMGARLWGATGAELCTDGTVPDSNPLLARPVRVELPPATPCRLVGLADVTSPLTGPSGAARMFAPQKGADTPMVDELESAMEGWSSALRDAGADVSLVPGAGAAGGLGAAILA